MFFGISLAVTFLDFLSLRSDEIKQLWESVRGDLTRQYKKRHREAMKKRKRGHGITMADREAE